jgi:alkylated DNA repair protein alkB family protein 1
MGTKTREDKPTPILLESGDILVMSGSCRRNFHGVPRILENSCPDYLLTNDPSFEAYSNYIKSARINVNVRQVFHSTEE